VSSQTQTAINEPTPRERRFDRLLQTDRGFFALLAAIGGAIAFLKGFRLPYSWAATQAQLDYRYGLVRRGLFGSICHAFHLPIGHYAVFSPLSLGILAIFYVLLFRLLRTSGLDRASDHAITSLVAASFCVSYLVNLVGYLDIVLAILAMLVISVRRPAAQVLCAALAGLVGVLIHEMYLFAFLPVSLVAIVQRTDKGWKKARGIAILILPIMVCIGLVLYLASRPALTPEQIRSLRDSLQAHSDFPLYSAFDVLARSTRESFSYATGYMKAGLWWLEMGLQLIAFLPTMLFFLWVAYRPLRPEQLLTKLWIALATAGPLVLFLFGVDGTRWLTLCTLVTILAAVATNRSPQAFGPVAKRVIILLIALNLATNVGMFEGSAKNFPFLQHVENLKKQINHHSFLQFDP
jgi:hypothetical protein